MMGTFRLRGAGMVLAMLLAGAAVAEIDVATHEHPVYRGSMWNPRVDLASGVVIHARGLYVRADDLETGVLRWTHDLPVGRDGGGYTTGERRTVVHYPEGRLVVLDNRTGEEVWRQRGSYFGGGLRNAQLAGGDRWLVADYLKSAVVHDLEADRSYKISLPGDKIFSLVLMPDRRRFVIVERLSGDKPPTSLRFWLWEPGVSEPEQGCTVDSPIRMEVRAVLPSGGVLLREHTSLDPVKNQFKIVDPKTGAVLRAQPEPEDETVHRDPSGDGTREFVFREGTAVVEVARLDDGAPLYSVPLPWARPRTAAVPCFSDGADWGMFWGDGDALWLVPLVEGGAPRRILGDTRLLPGRPARIDPPYLPCFETGMMQKTLRRTLFTLPDLALKAEWDFPPGRGGGWIQYSADSGRAVQGYFNYDYDNQRMLGRTLVLKESGKDAPLLEMPCQSMAISPDGRHLVAQEGENRKLLVEVDTRKIPVRITAEREYDYSPAAFSPDSRRAALFCHPRLVVVDIAEGYPEREMDLSSVDRDRFWSSGLCFSQDGKRLLVGGSGEALLFDADTGKRLHTFTEEQRFQQRWQSRGYSFLSTLEGMARDIAGNVTDRFKGRPDVQAVFSANDTRVVTLSEGQLVRVWDARTRQRLHTIDPELPETRNRWGGITNRCVCDKSGQFCLTFNENAFAPGVLWDLATGRKLETYHFPEGTEYITAAISEDGKTVYAAVDTDLHLLPGRK